MPIASKQIVILYQSGNEKLNDKALMMLSKLEERGDVEVRIASWCPMLEKYFHFPAIEVGAENPETSFKRSGIDSILGFVDKELQKEE